MSSFRGDQILLSLLRVPGRIVIGLPRGIAPPRRPDQGCCCYPMILRTKFSGKATDIPPSEAELFVSSMVRSYLRKYSRHFSQWAKWSSARTRSGSVSSPSLNASNKSTNSSHFISYFFIAEIVFSPGISEANANCLGSLVHRIRPWFSPNDAIYDRNWCHLSCSSSGRGTGHLRRATPVSSSNWRNTGSRTLAIRCNEAGVRYIFVSVTSCYFGSSKRRIPGEGRELH